MPITQQYPLNGSTLALWKIDEDETVLRKLCTPQEQAYASGLAARRRHLEWLAWHALLHELSPGAEVFYRPSGAPALRGGGCLSVSHGGGYAALLLSDAPCGLDIERAGRDYSKAESRFLSSGEKAALAPFGADAPAIGWCAKEAMYKWSGLSGLDLIADMRLRQPDPAEGLLYGSVRERETVLRRIVHPELVIVFCPG